MEADDGGMSFAISEGGSGVSWAAAALIRILRRGRGVGTLGVTPWEMELEVFRVENRAIGEMEMAESSWVFRVGNDDFISAESRV